MIAIIGNSHTSQKIALQLKKESKPFLFLPGVSMPRDELDKIPELSILLGDYLNPKFLEESNIKDVRCVIISTKNDETNIYATLQVKEINPNAKIIVDIFNHKLGKKLEDELENCYTLSPSNISAPSFASASIFKYCFFSITYENEIYSFVKLPLSTITNLQNFPKNQFEADFKLITLFGEDDYSNIIESENITNFPNSGFIYIFGSTKNISSLNNLIHPSQLKLNLAKQKKQLKVDKFLLTILSIILFTICIYTIYFHFQEKMPWISAFYFVMTTLCTVGYGDFNLKDSLWISKIVGVSLMLSGISLSALLFAILTDFLIKKRTDFMEGRKKYKLNNHIIVCGLGTVGLKIVDTLISLDEKVLVIENKTNNFLLKELEKRSIPFMIANATEEQTLIDANIKDAKSIICAINGDLTCLEIGLNARSIIPNIRVILRIFDDELAKKIQKHFHIQIALSTSALCARSFIALALQGNIIGVASTENRSFILANLLDEGKLPPGAIKLISGDKNLYCYPIHENL